MFLYSDKYSTLLNIIFVFQNVSLLLFICFVKRMLTQKWRAFLQSSSEILTLCPVISLLAWCSCARDKGLRGRLSLTRYDSRRKGGGWKDSSCFAGKYLWIITNDSLCSSPKANNDILAFLSGIPVTRNTKYLDLKNSVRILSLLSKSNVFIAVYVVKLWICSVICSAEMMSR